jgi:hypothetical protein
MRFRLDFSTKAHPSTPFRKKREIPLRMLALPITRVFGQKQTERFRLARSFASTA